MRRNIQFLAFALLAVSLAPAQILTDSLIAWYPLNGNVLDASGKGNNGTVVGSITFGTDRFGRQNSAASFPGTGSFIDCGSTFLPSSPIKVTQSVWIKTTTLKATISDRRQTDNGMGWVVLNIWNGYAQTYLDMTSHTSGGTRVYYADSVLVNDNNWHFICSVYDKSVNSYSLYIDGVLNNIVTDPATFSSTQNFQIGHEGALDIYADGRATYSGLMDDIRIYNRALSATEIAALYNEGLSTPISINKTGFSGSPASFSVDSTFNSVVATFNTSVFSNIDTLYVCYETSNLTYLTQLPDKPANYTVNVGGAVADFGNNISAGTFSPKAVNITALKALSANFQVTFNYTGGGGEIIFADPYLLVYGSKTVSGAVQKTVLHPQSLMKATAHPNPTHSSVTINYSVPFISPLDISIYDANGKLVKNVFRGLRDQGLYNYIWDGTNLSGAAVANGNYFFRVRATNGQQVLEQIVVLK